MNQINDVWQRILDYSTNTTERPIDESLIFETKVRHIKFWIFKIDENTILPVNERASKLYRINKAVIQNDIENDRGGNIEIHPKDFNSPAPSYRCAILNDPRIWIKE